MGGLHREVMSGKEEVGKLPFASVDAVSRGMIRVSNLLLAQIC